MHEDIDQHIGELAAALVKRHGCDALVQAQANLKDAIEVRNAEAIQFWREVKTAIASLSADA